MSVPDMEAILGDYLRDHQSVAELGTRVAGETPDTFTRPWVRITQLDDSAVGGMRSDHLIEYLLQFDCYAGSAGGQPEARDLSEAVRTALRELPDVTLNGAVVTGVDFVSAPRLPDTELKPARERYVRTVTVWAHP